MIVVIKKEERIEITIPKKFSEKHIGSFINDLYECLEKYPNYSYNFDFTHTEWIANQNLLLLSGLIKYLYNSRKNLHNSGKKLNIKLLPDGYKGLNKRKVEAVCELWYTWQFINIFDKEKYDFANYIERFGNDTLESLCKEYKVNIAIYKNKLSLDLYDSQTSVIPFVSLNYIESTRFENTMNAQLKPVYELNQIISSQLDDCKCAHPFISKTISAIVTKELYDNFLDHFDKDKSFIKSSQNWAFMSISLKRKRPIDNQNLFESNFSEEELEETKSFFFDNKSEKYKNENLIQFSFFDFGEGIVKTLKEEYIKENNILQSNLFEKIDDNDVLKYAFNHNSSRNPILDKYEKINNYIPRGLYDLLVIVKRYYGLLIVRSNNGKIIYNFSDTNDIVNPVFLDTEKIEYFPGTYFSIYIPAWKKDGLFDKSVIQPEYEYFENKPKKSRNINLFSIVSELSTNPDVRYKQLIENLSHELEYDEKINKLTYISFWGVSDSSIINKIILYLVGTYDVNEHNSIIIVHPPSKKIIAEINNKILDLDKEDKVIQDFKIHPIPVIYLDIEKKEINLDWIGIFNEEDKKKLNDLLFEVHSLILQDFKDGHKAIGNTNRIDKYGNFLSKLPIAKTLLTYYERYESKIIEDAINDYSCEKKDGIYLCNSNYYQDCFLQLTDVLNSRKYGNVIPLFLLDKIKLHVKNNNPEIKSFDNDVVFIAITASSHKILKALIQQKDDQGKRQISEENCLLLDSYLNFESEIKDKLKKETNYVLVCDAIATGKLTEKLDAIISENNSKLILVAVIINALDANFENFNFIKVNFIDSNRFVDLYRKPILKFKKNNLSNEQKLIKPIRINPYTNVPITLSDEVTFKDSVLLTNDEFLECIKNEDIEIRFKLFNNLIHPYFFKTSEILKNENFKITKGEFSHSLIYKIFEKLKTKDCYKDTNFIFYPKNSDIKHLEVEQLQIETKIFGRGGVKYFELERYNPGNGWKFPHTTEYFRNEIEDKVVLILDDGSCSGDSLYQMINELSYYRPNTINVISLIGRVEDHKREFFSKIKSIKSKIKNEKTGEYEIANIDVHIYFGTQWYIPTFYRELNPYIDEYNWLEKISKIQNIPDQIKKFAKHIKSEISPKSDQEVQQISSVENVDYKYFPKTDDSTLETKKELLSIRNEIGKIIGYRFYKENFDWFNDFIKKIDNTNFANKEINKDIELLLMCIIYEPYLYKRIIQIIPEIEVLIIGFIEFFVFRTNDVKAYLNYKWNKVDFVHLYFISYSDNDLVDDLTLERFQQLINFIEPQKVNYILFKLLYYSPDNNVQYKVTFNKIRNIIDAYLQTRNVDKNVKLFRYFITSVLDNEDFEDNLSFIVDEYRKINDSQMHKEAININVENLLSYLELLMANNSVNLQGLLQNDLKRLLDLISRILSISYTYPHYFSKYIYLFENDSYSLRIIHKELAALLSINGNLINWKKSYFTVKEFSDNFLSKETVPFKILSNTITENFQGILLEYQMDLELKKYKVNINNFSQSKNLFFPTFIFKEIVFNEIFSNIERYADNTEPITINVSDNIINVPNTFLKKGQVVISINNKRNMNINQEGSFIGTHLIKKLNDYPNNMFYYTNNKTEVEKNNNESFWQTIIFKSI